MYDQELIREIESNSENFLKALSDVSPEQAMYKPSPEQWSVLECVEHIVLMELLVTKMLSSKSKEPLENVEARLGKDRILNFITNRRRKVTAPDMVQPSGKFTDLSAILEIFVLNRQSIIVALAEGALEDDTRYFPHPYLGDLNKREWVHVLTSHLDRHLEQIREVILDF